MPPTPCPLPPLLPHAILTSCLFLPPDRRLLDQALSKPGALFFHSFPPSQLEDRQLQQQPSGDGLQHLGPTTQSEPINQIPDSLLPSARLKPSCESLPPPERCCCCQSIHSAPMPSGHSRLTAARISQTRTDLHLDHARGDADQNRGAKPNIHTASWACVMERNQPSRSSRQAGWQGGQPASLAPCVPLSPNTTCLLTCIALTDMFSVSGPPSSRTATQHSPRVFRPIVHMCRTMAARTWLRVGASCPSVCSRTASFHSSTAYLHMRFPWPNAAFDMSCKEA